VLTKDPCVMQQTSWNKTTSTVPLKRGSLWRCSLWDNTPVCKGIGNLVWGWRSQKLPVENRGFNMWRIKIHQL